MGSVQRGSDARVQQQALPPGAAAALREWAAMQTERDMEGVQGGPTDGMRQMMREAQELAIDGTAEGTLRALEIVTGLIRETRGSEQAVLDALKVAKENHQRVMFAHERPGENWVLLRPVGTSEELGVSSSLLGEGGRAAVISDAAQDGSSCMCTLCGCLVAKERLEAHVTVWCPSLPDDGDSDEEGGECSDLSAND
uniref:C2HC zinc finger plants domain-containing protein n=1 Tax=Hemiselmis andersenii TaxID=464988 RepID=A0A6U4RX21_HEMAN|mmetsp:Transcript_23018/g.53518  ORF Transcript_23018/g.53518 Transcript_23018/m.53518 type:complete len:197 (+) Transcript_23018:169-759(+)